MKHRRSRIRSIRRIFLASSLGFLGCLAALAIFTHVPQWASAFEAATDPDRVALRLALKGDRDLGEVYASRYFRPIWTARGRATPDAERFLHVLALSGRDDLDPARYEASALIGIVTKVHNSSAGARAQLELRLSHAFLQYISDLHTPLAATRLAYTDPALVPPGPPSPKAMLAMFARSADLSSALIDATRMNPIYLQYRAALGAHLLDHDPAVASLLRVNLERARALPVLLGRRYLLVDTASASLWFYRDSRPVDSMKVVVGTQAEPTPLLAGVVRYTVFNPYWNVPPDLVRRTYAPRILARPAILSQLRMDAWSDYSPSGQVLNTSAVDWAAVSRGSSSVGLRQRPGANNFMGAAKFMFPNEFGIYLHDTPERGLFLRDQRTFSAGCVRVEDYRRLVSWLYGGSVGPHGEAPEQRVNLPSPVPVYITYFTADLAGSSVVRVADTYGRDPAVLTEISLRQAAPSSKL
jgi:murein L,D-transpeptidase YcbB/YkuD